MLWIENNKPGAGNAQNKGFCLFLSLESNWFSRRRIDDINFRYYYSRNWIQNTGVTSCQSYCCCWSLVPQ